MSIHSRDVQRRVAVAVGRVDVNACAFDDQLDSLGGAAPTQVMKNIPPVDIDAIERGLNVSV